MVALAGLNSRWEAFAQLLTLLVVFIFVLALTYFATRWAGNMQKTKMAGRNIQILETMRVSNTKYIQIIKIGSKCFAVAVCKDTITYLSEINEQELTYSSESKTINTDGFKAILEKFKKDKPDNELGRNERVMLQWIRKHRKALAGISVGAGAFFAAISFITYKVMAAEETTASENNLINIGISTSDGNDMASVLQMLLVLTVISLAPSILIMLTSFTRIVIVLHFTRAALGTQTVPPNQVIIGLSLFLTFFVMSPVFTEVYDSALKPLSNNEISVEEAYETGVKPLKSFMLKQTSTKDLDTFFKIAGYEEGSVTSEDDISMTVLVPSFIISELRIAFIIGFLIYIPFIIIDMVVSSTLMSMGMMMLPPTTISAPFKILLFVMADGWNLIIGNLVATFK